MIHKFDIVIIGGGITGLSLAYQLVKHQITNSIVIIDKENHIGAHTSGRNSGILHAGIYYKPGSLKSKICVRGAKRLKKWALENDLNINQCGKYIVPQDLDLDYQLDVLKTNADRNGARSQIISKEELVEKFPSARTASNRALWSPDTCVVNPLEVLFRLKEILEEHEIIIQTKSEFTTKIPLENRIETSNGDFIEYKHLINTAGIQACKISSQFGVKTQYNVIPFKGEYWKLKSNSKIRVPSNLYPVPDLNIPFLGIHFTPSSTGQEIYIGPTATLALGKENYHNFENLEGFTLANSVNAIARQYYQNKKGFRKYVHSQSLEWIPLLMHRSAQKLIPELKPEDMEKSQKVGIRPQLYDKMKNELVDDFVCLHGERSTHILNAISPAFTSSFELADYIMKNSNIQGDLV